MKLEDLEKSLYQKTPKEEKIFKPSPVYNKTETDKNSLKTDWNDKKFEEGKTNRIFGFLMEFNQLSRWLFWILIAALLIIIAIAGFYFYQYSTSRDVNLSLKAPTNVLLGTPFNIEIEFQNNSNKPLQDVKLSMILPDNTTVISSGQENLNFLSRNLGDLKEGASLKETIPVIIFGNEQSLKQFQIAVSYFPPTLGPKARFEKTKNIEVSAREPSIKLDLTAPQKVLNNEDFEIEVHYQNISDIDFSGVELQIDYPDFFTFKSASVKPSVNNNIWKIDNLAKNSPEQILIIKGSAISTEESFFEIKGSLRVEFSGQKYLISEKTASLNIASSPLALNITLNDQHDYLAFPDANLRYKINYRNNSDVGLNDTVITAQLSGEMFDFKSLRSQGFFDSKNNIITWNTANTPTLRILEPGASGSVEFEIRTQPTYPIKRMADKNFTLKIKAEISSPTVPYYVASNETIGLTNFETKVAGKISIDSQAFFRDPDSGILNKGSLPPKVNTPTNFTIHWIITNYSTDVHSVEIKTFLQSGVRFTGQVKSSISTSTVPTYNERTQEVIWTIDKIIATKGVISKPVEAIFQIEATPDITQVNKAMPLISETQIKAIDEFSNTELKDSHESINTQQVNDSIIDLRQGTVIQ